MDLFRDEFRWFSPIYTETGLSKQKLELRKREILIRNRVSVAFRLPAVTMLSAQNPIAEGLDDESLKMLELIDARTASFSLGSSERMSGGCRRGSSLE